MPDIRLSRGHCNDCERSVLAVAEVPKHSVWALISIVTAGIGMIAWIIVSMRPISWRCAHCGSVRADDN